MGSRIIGGTEVPEAKYPFAAALVLDDQPLRGPFCGGSLIAPQVVLTAARCFVIGLGTPIPDISVALGCLDVDSPSCEVIPVVQTVLHPNFNRLRDESNDVAVVKLDFPSNQPVITLGKARPQVGDIATICGWGAFDEFGYGYDVTFNNKVLREVNLAIVGNEACQQAILQFLDFIRVPIDFPITDEMMCGIGDFQGSCLEDEGAPLFIGCEAEANKEVQVGIVSHGINCAFEGVPEVFTSISAPSVFNFIEQETLKLGGVGIKFTEDLDGACSLLPLNVEPTPFPTRLRRRYNCNIENFFGLDGCHCECGLADPDCSFMQVSDYFDYEVINCDPGQFCFDDKCVDEIPNIVPTSPPRRTSEPTTKLPTLSPTHSPTLNPTMMPTNNPTLNPTKGPTFNPTQNPTVTPTKNPTEVPTKSPTQNPTLNPTEGPTVNPTTSPTELATESPSEADVETDAPTVRDDGGLDPPTKEEEKDDANQEVMEILVLAVPLLVLCLLLLLCYCCLCKTKPRAEKDAQPQASSLVA